MADAIKEIKTRYNYRECPLADITELRDNHLQESINNLEKQNQEEHKELKKQINDVKEELGAKIDETSSSIKKTIEKTLQNKAGQKALKAVKWVGGIVLVAAGFVFKDKLVELFSKLCELFG